jgi:hypothetical protein
MDENLFGWSASKKNKLSVLHPTLFPYSRGNRQNYNNIDYYLPSSALTNINLAGDRRNRHWMYFRDPKQLEAVSD